MFTGLVEEMGEVARIERSGEACQVTVAAERIAVGIQLGDSVSISGCCLTVVSVEGSRLGFQAGSETLNRTNLGGLGTGSRVNLERALRSSDRLGGHYVSGHVDAIGRVTSRVDRDDWAEVSIEVPGELTRQMASKGSIAMDGVSLTLVDVGASDFSVALIPHTLEMTTLGQLGVGDAVNIETDILAKYVQQQLQRGAII